MKRLPLLLAALAVTSSGETTTVPVAGMSTFTLDPDGDGLPEISAFHYETGSGYLWFNIQLDAISPAMVFPDQAFVGFQSDIFLSIDQLVKSPLFSGNFQMPASFSRTFDSVSGVISIRDTAPVAAIWMLGTKGTGAENVNLIGMVVDATEYFRSGRTVPVTIYHRNFGSYTAGGFLTPASLAGTGLPIPRTPLDATNSILGVKSGTIRVLAKAGKIYRLMKGDRPYSGLVVTTATGNGQFITFPWDDSTSNAARAFFWVEESTD